MQVTLKELLAKIEINYFQYDVISAHVEEV